MPSPESHDIRNMLLEHKPDELDKRPFPVQREEWENWEADQLLPEGTTVKARTIGAVPCEVVASGDVDDTYIMMMLHGGGFVLGSCVTHRGLASKISAVCGVPVLLVDYRLAPEHPYPAGLDDAVSVYEHLLNGDYQPEQIILCGDSAGGGLVVSAMLRFREQGLSQPMAGILLSPWLDLALTGVSVQAQVDNDPTLLESDLRYCAGQYVDESQFHDPLVSPVYADLNGLPPLLIHVGEHELILSDSVRLADNAKAVGIDIQLTIWDEMWHVFHSFAPDLPEANQALADIGAFVKAKTQK